MTVGLKSLKNEIHFKQKGDYMDKLELLKKSMIKYYSGDAKRIQHFIKVHSFAELIGKCENLDNHAMFILEAAALTHDIGIKVAEQKYNSCSGALQEKEGPAEAQKMLESLDFEQADIDRICYLIAHHHTYKNIDSIDYQILVEADFLVNLYEDSVDKKAINTAYCKIFKTISGKDLCKIMFNL